jgi:ERCC4-type nuclease
MASIICDDRETNGATPYFEAAIAANNKKYSKLSVEQGGNPLSYSISRITTGDYHIMLDGIIYLSFERKTWKDLAASIKDQRLGRQHRQMENLSSKTGCRILYIIEGTKKSKDGKIGQISVSTLETKLRRMFLRGSNYEISKNQQDTANIIVHYAREITRLIRTGEKIAVGGNVIGEDLYSVIESYNKQLTELNAVYAEALTKYNEQLAEYIREPIPPHADIPQIEPTQQTDLLTQQNVKSDQDVIQLMWCCIKNVSEKTYPVITQKYKLRDIILADLQTAAQIRDDIAQMHYPGSNMTIGKKRAESIVLIGYNGKIAEKKAEAKAVAIKLLSQIPGVSEDTAKLILSRYSLKDMCRGKSSIDELSSLTRENGRKIGKIGETVYKFFNENSTV